MSVRGNLVTAIASAAKLGCVVERTEIDSQQVSIVFENRATVSISFHDDDDRAPEALEFRLDDRIWVV